MVNATDAPPRIDEPVEAQLARHITAIAAQTHLLGIVSSILLNRLESEGILMTEDIRQIHDNIEVLRHELMPQMLPADQARFEAFVARFEA
jgi:hypothetical protein